MIINFFIGRNCVQLSIKNRRLLIIWRTLFPYNKQTLTRGRVLCSRNQIPHLSSYVTLLPGRSKPINSRRQPALKYIFLIVCSSLKLYCEGLNLFCKKKFPGAMMWKLLDCRLYRCSEAVHMTCYFCSLFKWHGFLSVFSDERMKIWKS